MVGIDWGGVFGGRKVLVRKVGGGILWREAVLIVRRDGAILSGAEDFGRGWRIL